MGYFAGVQPLSKPLVFISYASKDRQIVDQLVDILDQYQIDVWIDHKVICYGDSIPEKISLGLEGSSAIISVITDNSINSNWCKLEYETALMDEIDSGRTKLFVIVIGNPTVPKILKRKKYFSMSLSDNVLKYNMEELEKLLRDIQNQTVGFKVASLISKTDNNISPICKNQSECIRRATSLISLIIGSVFKDFPVDKITRDAIINGHHMKEIYLTVDKFIEEFYNLTQELLKPLVKSKQGDISYYLNHQSQIKRNLLHIQHQMKEIAASLRELSGVDPVLKVRFDDISNICVDIADAEGIGLDVLVGYDGIKDKRKIIDSMDYNKLRTGGGRYNSNISDEIIELNGLLDKIAQYRKELLIAIGNAI